MPRAATQQGSLADTVKRALSADPDYTEAFTEKVQSMALRIEKAIRTGSTHDADMNYNAGQQIIVFFDKFGRPVSPASTGTKFRITTVLSSKGPFFAFVVMKLSNAKQQPCWLPDKTNDSPGNLLAVQKQIAALLFSNGYSQLEEPLLSQPAEGRLTELDGQPATVFNVLFGELI